MPRTPDILSPKGLGRAAAIFIHVSPGEGLLLCGGDAFNGCVPVPAQSCLDPYHSHPHQLSTLLDSHSPVGHPRQIQLSKMC